MRPNRTALWVVVLYAISGLPFGMVYEAIPIYLRIRGLTLKDIGLTNLAQLAWGVKVLWGPLVERTGSPRRWIVGCLVALAVVHLGLAVLAAGQGRPGQRWLSVLLMGLALAAATQDIAIDGLFVRMMAGGHNDALGNSLRVSAYRVCMVLGGSGVVMLAGIAGWSWVFVAAAAVFAAFIGPMLLVPTEALAPQEPAVPLRQWLASMWVWLAQPGALGTMAFIMIYRAGDAAVNAMSKPFWVDRHVPPLAIGFINSSVGVLATVLGAWGGGRVTMRYGVVRALWWLGLAQAGGALCYAAVACFDLGTMGLYTAGAVEHFTHGLATAALMTFLTRLCEPRQAATQFAALTASLAFMRAWAGASSGIAVEHFGFAGFFLASGVVGLPAFVFLPAVRRRLAALPAENAS